MKNLVSCPDCQKEISRKAELCPNCGLRLRSRQTAAGILAAVVLGLIICWLIMNFAVPHLIGGMPVG